MTKAGKKTQHRLLNFRPAFFLALFLCLGISFSYAHYFNGTSIWAILLLFPLATLPIFLCAVGKEIWDKVLIFCLLCTVFFIGFFSFTMEMDSFYANRNGVNHGVVVGRVVEKREYSDETVGLVLDRVSIEGEKEKGRLVAYMPASIGEDICLADEVRLAGSVSRQLLFYEETFQAKRVKKDIRFSMQAEEIEVVGHSFNIFLFCRQRAESMISAGMDGETAAITQALLFGNTYAVDEGLYENIRMGGIAHIFAVSGLHMGALFGFCLLLFRKTALSRLSKAQRFCCIAGICFFYAGVCGFTSSVVRALIMCLTAYGAKLIGVKSDMLENMGVAAIVILLCAPSSFFEVGFQLSFAACLGIGVLSKGMGQVFDEIGTRFKIRVLKREVDEDKPLSVGEQAYRAASSFLAVSFSAQIFTMPLLLHGFGYISLAGILLNCIFIPLVSAVFGFLLCLIVLCCFLPVVCAKAVLFLPNTMLSVMLLLFDFFNFSKLAIKGLTLSVYACAPYFLVCGFASDKWNLKRKTKMLLFLVGIGGMVLVNLLFSLAF